MIDDNHQADAGLEPGQDRLRNEIGDKAETQGARGQQHRPDEDGKRGRRHQRIERGIGGERFPNRARAQDGDGRRGADAQHPRRAENGVNRHRNQRRKQTGLHRQLRDRRVGERLGQDDGGGREAGYEIGSEISPEGVRRLPECSAHHGPPLSCRKHPIICPAAHNPNRLGRRASCRAHAQEMEPLSYSASPGWCGVPPCPLLQRRVPVAPQFSYLARFQLLLFTIFSDRYFFDYFIKNSNVVCNLLRAF